MAEDHEVQSVAEDAVPVESLIEGRAKRSTAGRLMSSLLDAEADDDLALLFEEIEDDNEFDAAADEEGAEEDDMGMDSSSDDDDDQGPNARADDFEGEKQIEKEEKAEKKKRRAQQDLRFKIASKKVKIDPTAVPAAAAAAPAPRPKKKSERISWIPTQDEGPTRSSSRRQTMQNKEITHARLKDSEEKRVRLIATMEEAAKRKAQFKPKQMTQAERLAEAERVERHNSKSLNRWEEMEKRKAEERQAKIEALQNRRLEGPVMSYWSGVATWVNGRITRLGKVDVTPKPEKEENTRRKSKKLEKEGKNVTEQKPTEDATAAESATSQTAPPSTSESTANPAPPAEGEPAKQDGDTPQIQQTNSDSLKEGGENASADTAVNPAPAAPSAAANQSSTPAADNAQVPETTLEAQAGGDIATQQQKETAPAETTTETPPTEEVEVTKPNEKVEESSGEPSQEAQEQSQSLNDVTSKPDQPAKPEQAPAEEKSDEASKAVVAEPAAAANAASKGATAQKAVSPAAPDTTPAAAAQPAQQAGTPAPEQKEQESPTIHVDQTATANEDMPQPEIPQPPPVIEQTGRSLTVLENFDDKTAQSREFSIYFNAKKPPRLTKISSSLCVITSLPSRYRDPETSLPFANAYAYNEIRHTVAQKYAWSPMLGCYVGPTQVAARGVPERFLGGPQAASDGKDSEQKESGGNAEPAPTEKDKEGDTNPSGDVPSASKPAPPATPTPVTTDAGDPMEVD
ncbi:YL1-domain-containing protein [Aspergillus steynii IBT 23096]|uniref:YL1-domain-containing protein n=1 Tax=Aspergillus steynii IBT 23096 TaxID=1392250 RepID=A0A2I2GC27_9EURO|nr:YL1-domain-containing protein [Aspergillus steynii IBT 23096]PLB50429.1 YL1-domain-containing protein [Aspergillus steynii IBT 23096]